THELIKPVVMPDNAGKVYHMELGPHRIWVTFNSSTIICLYDTQHMIELLQVDYPQLLQTELP
uniref:Uncharacterized protein n=1 Tax=Amphimedon queenslandica TaxID=400682 RepID=A0A1X7V943_AMPQE